MNLGISNRKVLNNSSYGSPQHGEAEILREITSESLFLIDT